MGSDRTILTAGTALAHDSAIGKTSAMTKCANAGTALAIGMGAP
jgi:hypothetical protein